VAVDFRFFGNFGNARVRRRLMSSCPAAYHYPSTGERHPDLVFCVESLYYLYTRQGGKSLKVVVLAKELIGVVGICLYPCCEILDCYHLDVTGDDCVGELFKVKPLVSSAFQHSVVQVEPVYIETYFHSDHRNAKAGLPRPCAASTVPWRVDANLLKGSRTLYQIAASETRGNFFGNFQATYRVSFLFDKLGQKIGDG